jgi:plasmid stabilization system protein ParE
VTYEVIFTPGAEADLDEIEQYLAERFSEANAQKYIQRIVAHCRALALAPYRGTKRDDIRPELRATGFERRVTILFQVETERVVIFGVFYGGRKFEDVL